MNHPESGTPPPVRRVGLIDQVAALFQEEITSGRWPVGERIPVEADLVAAFGAGRNTVREALQSLVHAGLLSREQGRGTFVISTSGSADCSPGSWPAAAGATTSSCAWHSTAPPPRSRRCDARTPTSSSSAS